MRKTKIVCTLGLTSNTPEVIGGLIDAGMNVARFNFSHGTHESHKQVFDIVRRISAEKNVPVATLLDTKGPEVRLGEFKDGRVTLRAGDEFTLTTDTVMGDEHRVSVTFKELAEDVNAGDKIMIDDGLVELRVKSVSGADIICEVVNGGEISNRKGLNVPNVPLSQKYISEQDFLDIVFGVECGFDFVAASFARCAEDILEVRKILRDHGGELIRIIAKIENAQGVENIDEILRVSDGIMVARGDMGVEIPFEQLPPLQKMLIHKAYSAGKMVITATQMLESMVKNPRPTRAEASDVANAIYDGTSATMLSGETANGMYPIKAVEAMAAIAERTENDINYRKRFFYNEYVQELENVTNAISHATCAAAYDLGAAAIITVTLSGDTARRISKYRPSVPIVSCTTSEISYRQLALSWGVTPLMMRQEYDLDDLFSHATRLTMETGLIADGDLVVITTGVPLGMSGTTNLLKVHIAGDALVTGEGVNALSACGCVCVAKSEEEAMKKFKAGDILVIKGTSNNMLSAMKNAAGIVTEDGGLGSHAAIVGLALDIPVIVGAKNATNILKGGTIVTIDAERGVVSNTSGCKLK